MFGELVDAVLFSATEIWYLEELPLAYAQQELKNQPRLLDQIVHFAPCGWPSKNNGTPKSSNLFIGFVFHYFHICSPSILGGKVFPIFGLTSGLLLSFVYGRRFSPTDLPSPGAVGTDDQEGWWWGCGEATDVWVRVEIGMELSWKIPESGMTLKWFWLSHARWWFLQKYTTIPRISIVSRDV